MNSDMRVKINSLSSLWAALALILVWACAWGRPAAGDLSGAAAGYVAIPGTHVSLKKPAGFANAPDFPGFQQKASMASVMVTELPPPFAQATAGFQKQTLAGRGLTLLSRESRPLASAPGLLLHLTQRATGLTFEKWIYAFGDARQTVLVTATFPKEAAAKFSASLKATVVGARWDRARAVDPFGDLRFRLTAQPPLQFAHRVGNMLLFTEGGRFPQPSPNAALFVAGYALADVAPDDKKAFSLKRLAQQPVRDQTVLGTQSVTMGGLSGYESTATGHDAKTGTPLTLYQVMLFEGRTYFLMFGITGHGRAKQNVPLFRATAQTLQRK